MRGALRRANEELGMRNEELGERLERLKVKG